MSSEFSNIVYTEQIPDEIAQRNNPNFTAEFARKANPPQNAQLSTLCGANSKDDKDGDYCELTPDFIMSIRKNQLITSSEEWYSSEIENNADKILIKRPSIGGGKEGKDGPEERSAASNRYLEEDTDAIQMPALVAETSVDFCSLRSTSASQLFMSLEEGGVLMCPTSEPSNRPDLFRPGNDKRRKEKEDSMSEDNSTVSQKYVAVCRAKLKNDDLNMKSQYTQKGTDRPPCSKVKVQQTYSPYLINHSSHCATKELSDCSLLSIGRDTVLGLSIEEDGASDLNELSIIQTCSACLMPSSELILTQCFHILCPHCIIPTDRNHIVCGICQKEQGALQEYAMPLSISSIFPGIFTSIRQEINEFKENFQNQEEALEQQLITVFTSSDDREIGSDRDEIAEKEPDSRNLGNEITESVELVSQAHDNTKNLASKTYRSYTKVTVADRRQAIALHTEEDEKNNERFTLQDSPVSYNHDDSLRVNSNTDANIGVVAHASRTTIISSDSSSNESSQSSSSSSREECEWKAARQCGACGKEELIEHACITCGGIPLCESCRRAHLQLPVTGCHEVDSVTSCPLTPLVLLTRHQPVCRRHGQDLALHCRTCSALICYRCCAPEHERHDLRELGSLHQAAKKSQTLLRRSVKQRLLATRSARRKVAEQRQRVDDTLETLRQAILARAETHAGRVRRRAAELLRQVEATSEARLLALGLADVDLEHAQREEERLRSVLDALGQSVPHLPGLVLHNACQARFNALRRTVSLHVEEFSDLAFCDDVLLGEVLSRDSAVGSVRFLDSAVADLTVQVLASFDIEAKVCGISVTPYNELVSISTECSSCCVWDLKGRKLLDLSRHVTRPYDVKVTPSGVIVIVDYDTDSVDGLACLIRLSPSGSVLSRHTLSSLAQCTHIHCPSDSRILVSNETEATITLYALEEKPRKPCLRLLRQVSHRTLLQSPRHVTVDMKGDWLVIDRGCFLRKVSHEDNVITILTDDGPDAALNSPPTKTTDHQGGTPLWANGTGNKRILTSVCCDDKGRVIAADTGRNGIHLLTTNSPSSTQRFLQLQDVTSSHVTAMAKDSRSYIIIGTSSGEIYVLKTVT